MKVTGKIIEKVEENWWALVTNSKTQLIYCEEKLTEGVTYTFIKPEEIEKDMWRVNKQLKPLKSKEVIKNNIDEKKKEHLVKKIIKDHSNTEFSQLCYYQMKWRKNKDFQTLAQNRRNIDSLGKLQD